MARDLFQLMTDHMQYIQNRLGELTSQTAEQIEQQKLEHVLHEFQIHTQIEEAYLYPQVNQCEGAQGFIDASRNSHKEMRMRLEQLAQGKRGEDLHWCLKQACDWMMNHIDAVQTELYPLLRYNLSADQINQLTEQIEQLKQKEPARQNIF